MSFTTTPRFALKKPTTGADNDIWGDHLNQNADTLDSAIPAPATTLPLVEGTPAIGSLATYARADHVHPAGGSSSGAATSVGDTPPGSPTAGQLWWESDSGLLFIYYTDANSSQWVPATVGTQGPPGKWTQITQAAYNALSPPDPATLYVVIG
jgi:hypothetical protein